MDNLNDFLDLKERWPLVRTLFLPALQARFIDAAETLSAAESCTGGGLAYELTSLHGSSRYFLGSIVAYATSWKEKFLKVPRQILETAGPMSREAVEAMVKELPSTYRLAISGSAGYAGGEVFFAIQKSGEKPLSTSLFIEGDRALIRETAIQVALFALYQKRILQLEPFS